MRLMPSSADGWSPSTVLDTKIAPNLGGGIVERFDLEYWRSHRGSPHDCKHVELRCVGTQMLGCPRRGPGPVRSSNWRRGVWLPDLAEAGLDDTTPSWITWPPETQVNPARRPRGRFAGPDEPDGSQDDEDGPEVMPRPIPMWSEGTDDTTGTHVFTATWHGGCMQLACP